MLKRIAAMFSRKWRYRSAVTGHYVSKSYALLHPRETVRERA
jgi:hypothetical protein